MWGIILIAIITIIIAILVIAIGSFFSLKQKELSTLATTVTMLGLFICVLYKIANM